MATTTFTGVSFSASISAGVFFFSLFFLGLGSAFFFIFGGIFLVDFRADSWNWKSKELLLKTI